MNTKISALLGVSAVALSAGAASAQTPIEIYGNGASLPAEVVRQVEDCYGLKADLVIRGSPTRFKAVQGAIIPGSSPLRSCDSGGNAERIDPLSKFFYISTGSGGGITTFFRNDGTPAGEYLAPADGTPLYPEHHYSVSETSIDQPDVNTYNNGGVVLATSGLNIAAPGTAPGTGQFANPSDKAGPMIQFPLLIAPVTVAYDPVYKRVRAADGSIVEFTLNQRFARGNLSGGLRMNVDTYCKIFNGQIRNWKDFPTALNGGQTLRDFDDDANGDGLTSTVTTSAAFKADEAAFLAGAGIPLTIVGRSDSSGTTSLFTRHMAAVCGGVAYTGPARGNGTTVENEYADSTSTLPTDTRNGGPTYNPANPNTGLADVPGVFTLAPGNEGVSAYLDYTSEPGPNAGDSTPIYSRVAYLSPDYALPASNFTRTNSFGIQTATLQNSRGQYVAPTPGAARLAYSVITPPDSEANGVYSAAADAADPRERENPWQWVEPNLKSSPLANPTANQAYPIVGTSNILIYTCYAQETERAKLTNFLNWYEFQNPKPVAPRLDTVNDPTSGVLARSGFSFLTTPFRRAITETFLKTTGTTRPLNLFTQAVDANPTSVCTGKPGAASQVVQTGGGQG